MRLVGNIPNLIKAREFSQFLEREGIHNDCEPLIGKDEGLIWIHNEDQVALATTWLTKFKDNPEDPFFVTPIGATLSLSEEIARPNSVRKRSTKKATFITFLLVLCSLIFIYTEWTAPTPPENIQTVPYPMVYMPQIMNDLLYDYPYYYELANKISKSYTQEQIENPKIAPKELAALLQQINSTTYWKGAYDEFIQRHKDPKLGWHYNGPMFEKIKEGQIWRLFTPILMHGNLLHILFNGMWIIVLGIQIEKKIGHLKTILFVLLTAIFSNTCQYLMSGPNFLGLSGVVIAMCGFIWMRQKKAPWEGYLLHSSTFLFIAIFVFGMMFIELISFFTEVYAGTTISPGIANTAHIAGGILGIILGKMKYFARKAPRSYHS